MNAIAKAFIFLIGFSAPAVWAEEPTSVHEFSERCAASYASAFEVPVELVEAVIQAQDAARLAQQAGITLVGWTRPPRLTVYCGELS